MEQRLRERGLPVTPLYLAAEGRRTALQAVQRARRNAERARAAGAEARAAAYDGVEDAAEQHLISRQ